MSCTGEPSPGPGLAIKGGYDSTAVVWVLCQSQVLPLLITVGTGLGHSTKWLTLTHSLTIPSGSVDGPGLEIMPQKATLCVDSRYLAFEEAFICKKIGGKGLRKEVFKRGAVSRQLIRGSTVALTALQYLTPHFLKNANSLQHQWCKKYLQVSQNVWLFYPTFLPLWCSSTLILISPCIQHKITLKTGQKEKAQQYDHGQCGKFCSLSCSKSGKSHTADSLELNIIFIRKMENFFFFRSNTLLKVESNNWHPFKSASHSRISFLHPCLMQLILKIVHLHISRVEN